VILLTSGTIGAADGVEVAAGLLLVVLACVFVPWAYVVGWGLLRYLLGDDGDSRSEE